MEQNTNTTCYSEVWIQSKSSLITFQCCTVLLQLSYTIWIGLPSITLRGGFSSSILVYDIPYVYGNNDNLMNSDSQLRNVSLSITSNTGAIDLLFIDLVFTNTDIDWILLSEVDICEGMHNKRCIT